MELPTDIATCHEIIVEQAQMIASLLGRVSKLEDQVNKNSGNSNKPPSSDGLKKKPAFPRKKGKKRGGQKGHKGKTLELTETPDLEVALHATSCSCGCQLDTTKAKLAEVRQVFDLPEPKLEVTEYQRMEIICPNCNLLNSGVFPEAVKARAQYGTGVRAFSVLLNVGFALPVKKIQQLFIDLFGYALNESTILSNNKRCSDKLESSEQIIKEQLQVASLGHADETGLRVEGKLHWLHVFCTKLFTYFFVHEKRGSGALEDPVSILKTYTGWVVHDCWSSYFKCKGIFHAICGAHILRELQALSERNTIWAGWFREYFLALLQLTKDHDGQIPLEYRQTVLLLFQQICIAADQIEPQPVKKEGKRGRPKATKGRNLLNRLIKHQDAVLAFAFHKQVPFTNNLAERDLRPAKTKQKVAGSFRTLDGAKRHARIYGFISSARKNQFNIFNELKLAFSGKTSFFNFQGAK